MITSFARELGQAMSWPTRRASPFGQDEGSIRE